MKLYILFTGRIRSVGFPVYAYLITTPGRTILVDTGYSRDRAGAYRRHPGEPVALEPGEDVPSQLAVLGLGTDQVDQVICTHFDPDHAGNHDAFPRAEFVVQRRHYEWARGSAAGRAEQTRSRWDRPGARLRLVDGDTSLEPGIDLVESSGHVPGHQSVLLRLPKTGSVLLAADAIPATAAMDADTRPIFPFDLDEAKVRASTKKLTQLAASVNARVICGHEPSNVSRLRHPPSYYD